MTTRRPTQLTPEREEEIEEVAGDMFDDFIWCSQGTEKQQEHYLREERQTAACIDSVEDLATGESILSTQMMSRLDDIDEEEAREKEQKNLFQSLRAKHSFGAENDNPGMEFTAKVQVKTLLSTSQGSQRSQNPRNAKTGKSGKPIEAAKPKPKKRKRISTITGLMKNKYNKENALLLAQKSVKLLGRGGNMEIPETEEEGKDEEEAKQQRETLQLMKSLSGKQGKIRELSRRLDSVFRSRNPQQQQVLDDSGFAKASSESREPAEPTEHPSSDGFDCSSLFSAGEWKRFVRNVRLCFPAFASGDSENAENAENTKNNSADAQHRQKLLGIRNHYLGSRQSSPARLPLWQETTEPPEEFGVGDIKLLHSFVSSQLDKLEDKISEEERDMSALETETAQSESREVPTPSVEGEPESFQSPGSQEPEKLQQVVVIDDSDSYDGDVYEGGGDGIDDGIDEVISSLEASPLFPAEAGDVLNVTDDVEGLLGSPKNSGSHRTREPAEISLVVLSSEEPAGRSADSASSEDSPASEASAVLIGSPGSPDSPDSADSPAKTLLGTPQSVERLSGENPPSVLQILSTPDSELHRSVLKLDSDILYPAEPLAEPPAEPPMESPTRQFLTFGTPADSASCASVYGTPREFISASWRPSQPQIRNSGAPSQAAVPAPGQPADGPSVQTSRVATATAQSSQNTDLPLMTLTQLNKKLAAYGFRPKRRRCEALELLRECGEAAVPSQPHVGTAEPLSADYVSATGSPSQSQFTVATAGMEAVRVALFNRISHAVAHTAGLPRSLYERILLLEPVAIEEVQEVLREAEVRVDDGFVREWCDEMGVVTVRVGFSQQQQQDGKEPEQ